MMRSLASAIVALLAGSLAFLIAANGGAPTPASLIIAGVVFLLTLGGVGVFFDGDD